MVVGEGVGEEEAGYAGADDDYGGLGRGGHGWGEGEGGRLGVWCGCVGYVYVVDGRGTGVSRVPRMGTAWEVGRGGRLACWSDAWVIG